MKDLECEFVLLRFWSRVREVVPFSAFKCWEWTGKIGTDGYGQMTIARKSHSAHRVSWQLNKGAIPDGLCVLHKCDNPACVRPSHLFLGTKSDNSKDARAKGRLKLPDNRNNLNSRKTHCLRGHEFSEANTAFKNGKRRCRECCRLRSLTVRNGGTLA